ncbi:MAG: hypothetical protein KDA44_13005 [Planctomycetales bacterium]|nr:hypothetical protein [Planctomycetales bacterium]
MCTVATLASAAQAKLAPPVGVPSLESLASEWLDVAELAHMPTLHNFHEMAACAPDLIGVNYNPGEQLFDWPVGPRWFRYRTLPLVSMTVDGVDVNTATCRWQPYQAVRRATVDFLEIETTVRLPFEGLGILYEIRLTNDSTDARTVQLELGIPGAPTSNTDRPALCGRSDEYAIDYAHAFVDRPAKIAAADKNGRSTTVTWTPKIEPGESFVVRFVMATGDKGAAANEAATARRAVGMAAAFQQLWSGAQRGWEKRWAQAFTPGNEHFSGHLPVLETNDEALREIYYRSVLTLLMLHRTNLAMCDRVFITSGERAKGVVFFWDTSMWAKVFALLEPRGMKEQLRLFLQCDPHRGPVCNLDDGSQWDGWYAANDLTIFQLAATYLAVTGDREFLDEQLGDATVLQLMERLATNWKTLQRDKSVLLADYGENENLLECAPAYVHRVPSFNAANVWMMRTVAGLYESRGDRARATALRSEADELAAAVLDLYKPGDGVWYALHRDGTRVELRHCYDFVDVGRYMTDDLTPQMQSEMVAFVRRELLTDKWMRAMSPRDEAAKASDRPDHGPLGAFDAWPALTAETMCLLGAWQPALDFLRSTSAVLDEGVYAQARECYGPRRYEHDAPVRIAMRGACMRECVGGGAFADIIIGTLFGFTPSADPPLELLRPDIPRGFTGTLRNVRYRDQLIDITSNGDGVSYAVQE